MKVIAKPPIATPRFWLAALVPVAAGLFSVWFCLTLLREYGWTLFIILPVSIGVAAALIFQPHDRSELGIVLLTNFITYLLLALLMAAMYIEGFVCMAMAFPLAFPTTIFATIISYILIKHSYKNIPTTGLLVVLFALVIMTSAFEATQKSKPSLHKVVTTVEIDASIEKVWQNVVTFPQINTEPDGLLRLGFAYPISAHIEGSGVGAIRFCNFNTGAFVEPITAWDEPHLLAFDVREQPPIMIETGLSGDFHPAHLNYLRPESGEFRLFERDGKTVIQGTTFYTHDIAPDWYWKIYSDAIIQRIHLRVLNHIKQLSEQR